MFIRQQVSSLASRYMTFRTLTLASSLSGYLGENLLLRGGDDINDIENFNSGFFNEEENNE